MAEAPPQRNLKRLSIWILILILAIFCIYLLVGGTSTPKAETGSPDSAPAQQP